MTLRDVIARLSEFEDGDTIYAERDPEWTESSAAVVAAVPPGDGLAVVLGVAKAKGVLRVWSERRRNDLPSLRERYEAILFYALNERHLPVD